MSNGIVGLFGDELIELDCSFVDSALLEKSVRTIGISQNEATAEKENRYANDANAKANSR